MTGPAGALPRAAVLQLVECRRRRRARLTELAAPVGAGVLAAAVVVAVQVGLGPAGPGDRLLLPAAPLSVASPPTDAAASPFDPSTARPGFLEDLADALHGAPDPDAEWADAVALAEAWDVPVYPEAKAMTVKARLTGTDLDVADGGAGPADRFARAGYTDDDAAALARVWSTDPRTAAVIAAMLMAPG